MSAILCVSNDKEIGYGKGAGNLHLKDKTFAVGKYFH
jgi:hypothetical protein